MARNTQKKEKPEVKEPTRNGLRNQAERFILDKYRDEYHQKAQELFEAQGLEYTRRATPEEQAARKEAERKARAEAKLEKLLEAEPSLREKLAQAVPNHVGELHLTGAVDNGMNTGAVGA